MCIGKRTRKIMRPTERDAHDQLFMQNMAVYIEAADDLFNGVTGAKMGINVGFDQGDTTVVMHGEDLLVSTMTVSDQSHWRRISKAQPQGCCAPPQSA